MKYNFTEKYSNYVLRKLFKEYLQSKNQFDATELNAKIEKILGTKEIKELCEKIDENFNNLLTLKLKKYDIALNENVSFVDRKKVAHNQIEFTYTSKQYNDWIIRVANEDGAKIKFMHDSLLSVRNYKQLEKSTAVKEYLALIAEKENINSSKNFVVKFFELKKLEKQQNSLEMNVDVHQYLSMQTRKGFIDAIANTYNELTDEELLNCTYNQIEDNYKIEMQEKYSVEFENYVDILEDELEVYKSFYNDLESLKDEIKIQDYIYFNKQEELEK